MNTLRQTLTVFLAGLVMLTTIVGNASAQGSEGLQCNPVHRAEMVEFAHDYLEFYNQLSGAQNPDYTQIYADDAVLASTAGVFTGIPQIAWIMSSVIAAIPDLSYTLEDVWVDGNEFTVRYSYSGTHLGDFLGIPATGNSLKVYGLEVNTVVDGKIVYTKNFTDFFGLLAQMGAVSLP